MKLSIGVFFGGRSVEHEVSVISAIQAMESMDSSKYDIYPFYITKEGVMYTGGNLSHIEGYKDIPKLLSGATKVYLGRKSANEVYAIRATPKLFSSPELFKIDMAFPIMHGEGTEDGSIQGLFESLCLPYVGSDVTASAIGMDKVRQKDVLAAAGLPVLPCYSFYLNEYIDDGDKIMDNIEAKFAYPVIVKPAGLGSSVGIKVARDRSELETAIDYASEFTVRILVERAITDLREINCAVAGDYEDATPSVCEEPVMAGEILSYSDKYLSGSKSKGQASSGMASATRQIPANISEEKTAEIQNLAVSAFKALGFSGVSRIDFLMEGETVYVNEPNTIPGSLAFYLFEASGMPYRYLLDKMIEVSLKKMRRSATLRKSFETNIFELKASGKSGVKK